MTTFVDTSALYPLLNADDDDHAAAAGWLGGPGSDPAEELVTHSYVVIETTALVHRRLGGDAVRAFLEHLLPTIGVVYVDEPLHRAATSAFLASLRRRPSLVDWVSFEMMRNGGIEQAFAFDRDFETQGFRTVP